MPWKTGPDWWVKISPKLFYGLMILNYILVPILVIGLSISYFLSPARMNTSSSYYVFYLILQAEKLLYFFMRIKPNYLHKAKTFFNLR